MMLEKQESKVAILKQIAVGRKGIKRKPSGKPSGVFYQCAYIDLSHVNMDMSDTIDSSDWCFFGNRKFLLAYQQCRNLIDNYSCKDDEGNFKFPVNGPVSMSTMQFPGDVTRKRLTHRLRSVLMYLAVLEYLSYDDLAKLAKGFEPTLPNIFIWSDIIAKINIVDKGITEFTFGTCANIGTFAIREMKLRAEHGSRADFVAEYIRGSLMYSTKSIWGMKLRAEDSEALRACIDDLINQVKDMLHKTLD